MASSTDAQSSRRRISAFFTSKSSSSTDLIALAEADDRRKARKRTSQHPPSSFSLRPKSQSNASIPDPSLNALAPPPPVYIEPRGPRSRASSRASDRRLSRPQTPVSDSEAAGKKLKRRSWLPNTSFGKSECGDRPPQSTAWIAEQDSKRPYDTNPLLQGAELLELWDNTGDTFIHLFPSSWQRRPSFRIKSETYARSATFLKLAQVNIDQLRTSNADGLVETPRLINLHLPLAFSEQATADHATLSALDIQTLIDVRNMFAFLTGQALVATEHRSTTYSLFLNIFKVLQAYHFTNIDGSTFGEVASQSFACYIDELNLSDVRASREKTIEALVLGEKMRSVTLYNEAFVHAVGKYDAIQEVSKFEGPDVKFNLISSVTRHRLERAHIDLVNREKSIDARLADFQFPSIFAGVMNSKMLDERKTINFGNWQTYFNSTRRFVTSYLKTKYGSWPPKASSKKNDLETSGLNRIVLKSLYFDFAELYDLYVDRTSLTSRTMGVLYEGTEDEADLLEGPVVRILRRVFDEYDRSSPPVQPPVPFDVPILPRLSHLPRMGAPVKADSADGRKLKTKKLSSDEVSTVLDRSVNGDILPHAKSATSPFLTAMRSFEARSARGCSLNELSDIRAGIWIFVYAVLQALPLLVLDAPGIKWHEGVEYFLCEPPRSGVPWARPEGSVTDGRGWYSITGGSGVVRLPNDLIEHGVEGIYRRSHCWLMAGKWSAEVHGLGSPFSSSFPHNDLNHDIEEEQREQVSIRRHDTMRLAPPDRMTPTGSRRTSEDRSRPSTTDSRKRENLLGGGLQALPMPAGYTPTSVESRRGSRAVSASAPERRPLPSSVQQMSSPQPPELTKPTSSGMTFDDILVGIEKDYKKTKKKK